MSSQKTDEIAEEEVEKPENEPEESESQAEEDTDSDSESDSESESEKKEKKSEQVSLAYARPDGTTRDLRPDYAEDEDSPESNVRRFMNVLTSKDLRRTQDEEDRRETYPEDLFDFPPDPERWREEDLKEYWADAPVPMTKPGWDPHNVDAEEVDILRDEILHGEDPPIAPFYVPYRKPYPAIPDNNFDISNAKAVIEELDRIEEFLTWVSYIFADGSSYEGTIWDDRAHGKGVFVAENGLVRYEGEWFQNDMDGHGIVEVDIPVSEPTPGSKLEAKMRAKGAIFSYDFMSPDDKKWLEMDIEDSKRLADGEYEIPFYENDLWIKHFGQKPEKGRYRYSGQWKHGRMHGCGVYQVNERTTWGRFYFGELLEDSTGCGIDICSMHAGIAEVAAAKARMFVNKPDGMVREYYGPFGDPQHAYFYEEDDVWMAPGFINQFYEVPDFWKTYVQEVDKERQLWLNSFYKAPLRLPMPSELEHWWSTYEKPEFVLVNTDPVPDPEDPSKPVFTEDPYILHTPTGRLIDYVEDEEHGLRLYWLPDDLKDGEDVDLDKVEFLPLGFDEFYGRTVKEPDTTWIRFLKHADNACKSLRERLEKLKDETKRASEIKQEEYKKQKEEMEAESSAEKKKIAALDEKLKQMQEEAVKKVEQEVDKEEEIPVSEPIKEEEEEEEAEENVPSSFGFTDESKGTTSGKSRFATASLVLASSGLFSSVPTMLQDSFSKWKNRRSPMPTTITPSPTTSLFPTKCSQFNSVSFHPPAGKISNLKYSTQTQVFERQLPNLRRLCKIKKKTSFEPPPLSVSSQHLGILSLHTPLPGLPHF